VKRLGTTPEGSPGLAAWALNRSIGFKRRLTDHERVAIAIAVTCPTNHVTFTTTDLSYEALAKTWRLLVRRIERRKSTKGPLIYVGALAKGNGDGGWHLHLILWEFPVEHIFRPQARAVGLGNVDLQQIKPDLTNRLWAASYVLGQHQSVFGTRKHLENAPHPKNKRALIVPQRKTLQVHNHELFVALDMAKSQAVSDERLCSELPRFIRGVKGPEPSILATTTTSETQWTATMAAEDRATATVKRALSGRSSMHLTGVPLSGGRRE
jgi:hypothetical protein